MKPGAATGGNATGPQAVTTARVPLAVDAREQRTAQGRFAAQASLQGEATWTVTPGGGVTRSGPASCSYTRQYSGKQVWLDPWVCPACDAVFEVDVVLSEGLGCYLSTFGTLPAEREWLGYGGGAFYRGLGGMRVSQLGDAILEANKLGWTARTDAVSLAEEPLLLSVNGAFTLSHHFGVQPPPLVPPSSYGCGWPKAELPPYEGDYSLVVGKQLPDGAFLDACGEAVRLHDLAGTYLLVTVAAMDCPACQQMADWEQWWVQQLALDGLSLRVVTLLIPSLGSRTEVAGSELLSLWRNTYRLAGPVLADRAWGTNVIFAALQDGPAMYAAYPSVALASPNLEVLFMRTGANSMWSVRDAIEAHAGYRRIEAEDFAESSPFVVADDGGTDRLVSVSEVPGERWVRYAGVKLAGFSKVLARVANAEKLGDLELRVGSLTGPLVATFQVPDTGGWRSYQSLTTTLDAREGVHDLYVTWTNQAAPFGDLDYLLLLP